MEKKQVIALTVFMVQDGALKALLHREGPLVPGEGYRNPFVGRLRPTCVGLTEVREPYLMAQEAFREAYGVYPAVADAAYVRLAESEGGGPGHWGVIAPLGQLADYGPPADRGTLELTSRGILLATVRSVEDAKELRFRWPSSDGMSAREYHEVSRGFGIMERL